MSLVVNYKSSDGQFNVEFTATDEKDLFRQLAKWQEIFEQKRQGKKNHKFIHRTDKDGNEYFELLCLDDMTSLGFGQSKKDKSLFPRRRNVKTKEPIGENGWHKFEPKTETDE